MATAGSEEPAAQSSIYTHLPTDPLNIRLLQIIPNDDRETIISCHMEVVEFSEKLHYRCLSYNWGLPENVKILVNGQELFVTRNLAGFLERIRARTGNAQAFYWIDAICINQQNIPERNVHVVEMGRIYKQADMVIAWLGWEWDRAGNGSELNAPEHYDDQQRNTDFDEEFRHRGLKYIRDLATAFRAWKANPLSAETDLSTYAFDDQALYDLLVTDPAPTWTWKSIGFLLNRAWFQRAWIIQEAGLAKMLIVACGFWDLHWDDFVQVSLFLHESGWFQRLLELVHGRAASAVPAGWQVILFTAIQRAVAEKRTPIPEFMSKVLSMHSEKLESLRDNKNPADILEFLVTSTMRFGAKDPKDKVYAPRALATAAFTRQFADNPPDFPTVDYDADTSQVLTEYSGYLLEHSSTLDLLSYAGDASMWDTPAEISVPSWAPLLTVINHSPLQAIPGANYDPLPGSQKFSTWNRDQNTLQLRGIRLDTLDHFEPPLDQMFLDRDLRPLITLITTLPPIYPPTHQPREEALWRTLIANTDEKSCPASPASAAGFKQYLQLVTAIKRHGNAVNPALQPLSDWSAWTPFDALHHSSPAAAAVIPSLEDLETFAEHWRWCMLSFANLPQAKKIGPADRYSHAVGRAYSRRCVFVSERKLIGLAPVVARKGDEIWLVAGAKVPFVLRPREGAKGRFMLVGELYVHGFMHGEALKEGAEVEFKNILLE